MPSTYISLLLLCGFIVIFYYTHKDARHNTRPAQVSPTALGNTPAVKKSLTENGTEVYLTKDQDSGNTRPLNGFSFFRDVIGNIAPVFKY